MAMTLGGRAAEEIVFGEITTGASNDLEKVTETAKQMVMRYGMSERLGPRVFGHDRRLPFLGREFSSEPDYSDEIAREIDDEIRRIVEEAHQTAKDILVDQRDELDRISKILLERETIDAEQFVKLLEGASEEEVFGAEDPSPSRRSRARAGAQKPGREGPRPVPQPRPGFAGGSAEMRADDPPERDRRPLPRSRRACFTPAGRCRFGRVPITTQYRKDSDDEASRGDSWLSALARSRGRRSSVPRRSPASRWPTTSIAALPPTSPSSCAKKECQQTSGARTTSSAACTGSAATRRSARSSSQGRDRASASPAAARS